MANMRPGDWICPSCNNHNYASKVNCNRCGVPKPGGAAPGGSLLQRQGGSLLQQKQAAAAAAGHSFQVPPHPPAAYGKQTAGGAARAAPYSAGAAQPNAAGMRPGDWCCPSCAAHNYASKANCFKCSASKMLLITGMAGAGGMMTMQHHGGMMQAQHQMQAQQQAQMSMGPFARAGDWKCPMCSNHNYARRTECNKCGGPKQDVSNVPNFRPGDWICPSCSNHNYSSKEVCNRCQEPKPANVPAPQTAATQGLKAGDWICPACGNHNYSSRVVCNRCQHPGEEATKVEEGAM